jgi:hypothetical protein
LVRRSFREDGSHESLANLSACPLPASTALRAVPAGETLVGATEAVEVERSLPHDHVAAVWPWPTKLGLAMLLGPPCPEPDLSLALVVVGAVRPGSVQARRGRDGRRPGHDHLGPHRGLIQVGGFGWVTSLCTPAIAASAASRTLQMNLFDEVNFAEVPIPITPANAW